MEGDDTVRRTSLQSLKDHSYGRLEQVVTVLVEAYLTDSSAAPPDLIERLRRLERTVREARGDRQIIQVITSGRRLLGDAGALAEPAPEPVPELLYAPKPRCAPARS
ncbi:hypothetical protein [Methylobacterium variabile]|jgi:hypothetical protein|uniref:hypothetical protein n=1 Tax=Methylobacterium variabile TaxID=298794 RepID=UPI00069EFBFD|nr:hypothetical protein [Methylobacterium variabile]